MRVSVAALIGIVLAMIVMAGVYITADNVWTEGGEEADSTGGFFSECLGEILTDEETECELFGETEEDPFNGEEDNQGGGI